MYVSLNIEIELSCPKITHGNLNNLKFFMNVV